MDGHLKRLFYFIAGEIPRSAVEYAREHLDWPAISAMTPRGDRHAVLVYPGIGHDELQIGHLVKRIGEKGYEAQPWDGGRNMGFDQETCDKLVKQVHRLYKETGKKPVSIVAHSFGGVYARIVQNLCPDMVRNVVTLGSPHEGRGNSGSIMAGFQTIYDFLSRGTSEGVPAGGRLTSVHSKTDPLVNWRSSVARERHGVENVEVNSSHVGLLWNPQAMIVVLDRLAQGESWRSFEPAKYPGFFSALRPQGGRGLWRGL